MTITIDGNAKEIAALVLAIQDRQSVAEAVTPYESDPAKPFITDSALLDEALAANDKALAAKLADMAAERERRTKKLVEDYPWNLRLYIRDKRSGKTHLVGSDVHDRLYVDGDGFVQYENMQNGDGTMLEPIGGYEFVPTPEEEL